MKRRNYGGMYQFAVETEEDLQRLADLDRALWAATSAPLRDLHCDAQFLAGLDQEATGRVRVAQVVEACRWTLQRLQNSAGILAGLDVLRLDHLASHGDGPGLRRAAEHLLSETGKAGQASVTLSEIREFRKSYATSLANGDGVVPPGVMTRPEVAELAKAILDTVGGRPDVGGTPGVGTKELEEFQAGAAAWQAWHAAAASAQVLGELTAPAWKALQAVRGPLEDFFWQCDLLSQQQTAEAPRMAAPEPLWVGDGAQIEAFLAKAPLANANAQGVVPGQDQLNPLYAERVAEFHTAVLVHLPAARGRPLDREIWQLACGFLQPFADWQAAEPKQPFGALGVDGLQRLLAPATVEAFLRDVAIDESAAPEVKQVAELERLVLNQQNLVALANNFVNFSAIYDHGPNSPKALIDTGNLIIDGRHLSFCIRVEGRDAHKKIAAESLCFLVYADVFAKEGGPLAYQVAAPVTSGERGRLRVGKRGLFVDNQNVEFDAIIVDIVENPISVKEAALAPFRRTAKMISEKMEQWLGSQQADAEKGLAAHGDKAVAGAQQATGALVKGTKELDTTVATAAAKPAEVKAPDPKAAPAPAAAEKPKEGINANTLILGGGMALAGVGAVLASLVSVLTTLKGWLAILGVVLAVAGLSALLGWLKLRRRDMSLLLEANGWAVNAQMKVTRRIGKFFTEIPADPPGTQVIRVDSLAHLTAKEDARRRRSVVLLSLLLLACIALAVALRYYSIV